MKNYKINILNATECEIIKYLGKEKEVVIPEEIDGYKVVGIAEEAFEKSKIAKVTIAGAINISREAFAECLNLTSVVILNQDANIDSVAFCYHRADCQLPILQWQVTDLAKFCQEKHQYFEIAHNELYMDGKLITDLVVPDGVAEIQEFAFQNFKLNSVVIPESVTEIGKWAFAECPIQNIDLGRNVQTIGYGAFEKCRFKNIKISKNVQKIGGVAFANCPLDTIEYEGTKKQWETIKQKRILDENDIDFFGYYTHGMENIYRVQCADGKMTVEEFVLMDTEDGKLYPRVKQIKINKTKKKRYKMKVFKSKKFGVGAPNTLPPLTKKLIIAYIQLKSQMKRCYKTILPTFRAETGA